MSQNFDQTHVQMSEPSSFPLVYQPRNTPRLQCMIPDISSRKRESPSPLEPAQSILPAMLNMEIRNRNAIVIDGTYNSLDHITSLEATVCSNFYCCGVKLCDFHALLEHFEEDHVVVLAPNGKRVYPADGLHAVPLHPVSSGSSTPASSRCSSVTPPSPMSPQTPPYSMPASPLNVLSSTIAPLARKSSFTAPAVYTPFTPSLPVDPAYPIADPGEIVVPQDSNFDFSVQPEFLQPLPLQVSSAQVATVEDDEMGGHSSPASSFVDTPISPFPTYVFGPDKSQPIAEIPKHIRSKDRRSSGSSDILKATASKSSKSKRNHGSSASHSRRREKMYRCPKEGCVKAYLNPNGLKYHLDKGTCKFEDDEEGIPAVPRPNTSPAPVPSGSSPGTRSTTPASTPTVPTSTSGNSQSTTSSLPALHPGSSTADSTSTGTDPAPGTTKTPVLAHEISCAEVSASEPLSASHIAQQRSHYQGPGASGSSAYRNPSFASGNASFSGYVSSPQLPQQQKSHPQDQPPASSPLSPHGNVNGTSDHRVQYTYPELQTEVAEDLIVPPICVPSQQPSSELVSMILPPHPHPHHRQTPQSIQQVQPQPAQLQQQYHYHYPVPTYPTGYSYAQQQRTYYVSEGVVYDPPHAHLSLMTGAGVVPSASSQ